MLCCEKNSLQATVTQGDQRNLSMTTFIKPESGGWGIPCDCRDRRRLLGESHSRWTTKQSWREAVRGGTPEHIAWMCDIFFCVLTSTSWSFRAPATGQVPCWMSVIKYYHRNTTVQVVFTEAESSGRVGFGDVIKIRGEVETGSSPEQPAWDQDWGLPGGFALSWSQSEGTMGEEWAFQEGA